MKIEPHNSGIIEMNTEPEFKIDSVLIIGNGFDLSFGFKTSYTDFIKDNIFLELLSTKNELCEHLYRTHNLQNWIDVENELTAYSKLFKGETQNFLKEYEELSKGMIAYLKNVSISLPSLKNDAYSAVEEILKFNSVIIDFNYTSTVQLILSSLSSKNKNFRHIKIHGSLRDKYIIFGVDDKAQINHDHIFLKKTVSPYYKFENFSKAITECKSLLIFGHSLGETDHMYFEDYFHASTISENKNSNKNVTIFYYDEKSRLDIHKQLDTLTLKKIGKFKQNNQVEFISTIRDK